MNTIGHFVCNDCGKGVIPLGKTSDSDYYQCNCKRVNFFGFTDAILNNKWEEIKQALDIFNWEFVMNE